MGKASNDNSEEMMMIGNQLSIADIRPHIIEIRDTKNYKWVASTTSHNPCILNSCIDMQWVTITK